MNFPDVILAAGARSAFGDFGKSLKDVPLAVLGAHVVKASLARPKLDPARVNHLIDTGGRYAIISMCLGSAWGWRP